MTNKELAQSRPITGRRTDPMKHRIMNQQYYGLLAMSNDNTVTDTCRGAARAMMRVMGEVADRYEHFGRSVADHASEQMYRLESEADRIMLRARHK